MSSPDTITKTYAYRRWNGNGWSEPEISGVPFTCDLCQNDVAEYAVTRYFLCEHCARKDNLMLGAFKPTEEQLREKVQLLSKMYGKLENDPGVNVNVKTFARETLNVIISLTGSIVGHN